MKVMQYVMAYSADHDKIRAIIPNGFSSIRPVLRIKAQITDDKRAYVEFNTAAEKDGKRGWLNIDFWEDVSFKNDGKKVVFETDFLKISFKKTGIEGSCPAQKDNDGCYFIKGEEKFCPAEIIKANKEFCDCEFEWRFSKGDAKGKSIGKTLPAYFEEEKNAYPKQEFSAKNAAAIEARQMLGSYCVEFEK